ncbi:MAG: hypothetical protein JNJ46_01250 [Myxococcales bacterium]|nr:hypothetical protein [Myxococcales bacterium]
MWLQRGLVALALASQPATADVAVPPTPTEGAASAAVEPRASSAPAAGSAKVPSGGPTAAPVSDATAASSPAPAAVFQPALPPRYSDAWLEARLRDLHERYPRLTRMVELGRSHEGRPLRALVIGRKLKKRDPRPAMLLNGAHHGVEILSIDMVLDAVDVLLLRSGGTRRHKTAESELAPDKKEPVLRPDPELDRRVKRWLDELVVWCVPAVNPDGVWATLNGHPRTGRKNGRDTDENNRIDAMDGVDLNRNYPFRWGALGEVGSSSKPQSFYYRGPEAGSEPETRAMMRVAESEHFAASISYHTGTIAVLAPYTIDNVQDPTPNEAWLVGEYMVAGLPPHPQGKPFVLKRKLYSVDGTDQDFYRARFGTLAYLVEAARRDAKDEAERIAITRGVRPSWMRLFDRFLDGPSVSGHVLDAAGLPVYAAVQIVEQTLHEGEVWYSRCRDGRFDRFLPGPGRYTLRVQAEGAAPVEQVIDVERGRHQVVIRLPAVIKRAACPPHS